MKTVLFINSSGPRYFRRENGVWQSIDKPDHSDRLWVIANLPEETLDTFKLPILFGRDRSSFIARRLAAAFPHSQYCAAPVLDGNWLKPVTAALNGLTTAEAVTSQLEKHDITVAGVWGISLLLTLLARRLSIKDVILAMPSVHFLRIVVLKDGTPVLTRCVHRYSEDSDHENDSDANEIIRTRQHLENKHFFERESIPPVLYLGDATSIESYLTRAGLTLMSLPDQLSPKGAAAYLHPLFELAVTSPRGQLAPLQLRASHLAQNLRHAAYAGIGLSLLAVIVFGQANFRTLIDLFGREQMLTRDLEKATSEREQLAARISSTGMDPALVRQATRFSARELEAAPAPGSLLKFTAGAIASLPQVRIKTLSYRFPKSGERYCQGQTVIEVPLLKRKIDLSIGGSTPSDTAIGEAEDTPPRYSELQFSILLTETLTPEAQIEIKKRISSALKARDGVQLMQDPAAFSLINTLKGGFGMDTTQTENLWCMSIPWHALQTRELP